MLILPPFLQKAMPYTTDMEISKLYELFAQSGSQVSTDSRSIPAGALYIALKGENFDGNAFTADALAKGASYAIIDNATYKTNDGCILVESTLKTLQDLAHHHRNQFDIPILAIGGSNGKTTTKELIYTVLSKKYRTHTTSGNLNNDIGVPTTLLSMPTNTEVAVIEIGANHPGEHIELMNILAPTHILVTNNGADHLEGFGSLEGVRKANKEIYDWAHEHKTHTFVNKYLDDLIKDSSSLERTVYPDKSHEDTSSLYAAVVYDGVEFTSSLVGAYNEANIYAAIAIGEYFNIPLPDIREAIADYTPTLKRSQYIHGKDYGVVLDCYNANPSSMELALQDFFLNTTNGTRIVIVGDMLEMGAVEAQVHTDILKQITELIDPSDIVICVGPRFYASKDSFPFHFYETTETAREYFNTLDLTNKTVFVKASRGIKLEDVIKEKIPLS